MNPMQDVMIPYTLTSNLRHTYREILKNILSPHRNEHMFSLNTFFDAVLVINMDKDKERLQQVTQQLSHVNTTFTRIPGIVPSPSFRKDNATTAASLFATNGMLGCFASHKSAWEYILTHKLKNALILEDDIVLQDHIITTLPAALHELNALPPHHPHPHMLYLGCMTCDHQTPIDKLFNVHIIPHHTSTSLSTHLKQPNIMVGTEAYMLTAEGAQLLLEHTPRIPLIHLDYFFTNHTPYLTKYAITPSVMFQDHAGFVHSNTSSKAPVYLNQLLSHVRLSPHSPTDGRTLAWLLSMPFAQLFTPYLQLNLWFFIFLILNIAGFIIIPLDAFISHTPLTPYSSYLLASIIGTLTLFRLISKVKTRCGTASSVAKASHTL